MKNHFPLWTDAKKKLKIISSKNYNPKTRDSILQISGSILVKGIAVFCNLLIVSQTINLFGLEIYGVWISLSTTIGWMDFINVGIGNKLRNDLPFCIKSKNKASIIHKILGSYIIVFGTSMLIVFILSIINRYGLITYFFFPELNNQVIDQIILITLLILPVRFVFKLISPILLAWERPVMTFLIDLITAIIIILGLQFIVISVHNTEEIISKTVLVLCCAPVISLIMFTFISFSFKKYDSVKIEYKYLRQEIYIIFQGARKFFSMHIANILMFSSDILLIELFLSSKAVGSYNILFRYFNLYTMLMLLIATPFWSSTTHEWINKNFQWIINSYKNLNKLWILSFGIIMMLILIFPWFINIWIKEDVNIEFRLVVLFGIYSFLLAKQIILSHFLSGLNLINIQYSLLSIFGIIKISLIYIFLSKYNLSLEAVLLTLCFLLVPMILILRNSFLKTINGKINI